MERESRCLDSPSADVCLTQNLRTTPSAENDSAYGKGGDGSTTKETRRRAGSRLTQQRGLRPPGGETTEGSRALSAQTD